MPMNGVEKTATEFEDEVVKGRLKVKRKKKKEKQIRRRMDCSEINKNDRRVQLVGIGGQSEAVLGKVTLIIHCPGAVTGISYYTIDSFVYAC